MESVEAVQSVTALLENISLVGVLGVAVFFLWRSNQNKDRDAKEVNERLIGIITQNTVASEKLKDSMDKLSEAVDKALRT